jgi:hypothetical protein
VYNSEQEFRPLLRAASLPAEHGRDENNGKAPSRPIGNTSKGVGLTSDTPAVVVHLSGACSWDRCRYCVLLET